MIRRNQEFLNRVNQFSDIVLVMLCYLFASWFWLVIKKNGDVNNMAMANGNMLGAALIFALAFTFILTLFGFYSTTRTRHLSWKLGILFLGTTITVLGAAFLLYLFRLQEFSRGVLFVFYGSMLLVLSIKYILMRYALQMLRTNGYNIKHEVVIGTGELARKYAADVKREQQLGLNILGFVGPKNVMRPLEGYDRLDQILCRTDIDEVVIALEPEEYTHIRDIITICERNGVKYSVLPFYNDIIPAHPIVENVGGSKLISMRSNRLENVGLSALKRAFDVAVSLFALIALSPLMIGIAIGVKLSSPGPVFFKQVRVGYKRQEFTMLKFRSMKVNDEEDTAWTKAEDSRRTRFGSFLRKTSLDELPQLLNCLAGQMSLVGPRPELPHFVKLFKDEIPYYMVKHQVKPGITGWAQVNGLRGDTNIEERVKYDLWYIDNWSVGLDLKIMFKTLFGGMINKEVVVKHKQHVSA